MNIQEILAALAKGEITQEEAANLLANPPKKPKGVYFEVSEKGAVKIKGIRQRFPIVLYPNEVEIILGLSDKLLVFIEENRPQLSFKKGDIIAKGDTEPADNKQAA